LFGLLIGGKIIFKFGDKTLFPNCFFRLFKNLVLTVIIANSFLIASFDFSDRDSLTLNN
jgi:hypothetical protein